MGLCKFKDTSINLNIYSAVIKFPLLCLNVIVVETDGILYFSLVFAICNCIVCLLIVHSHMTSVSSQLSNISKPGQEMKVTSEWRLDRLFRGYAAKMTDE